jgi:hypothetical protein
MANSIEDKLRYFARLLSGKLCLEGRARVDKSSCPHPGLRGFVFSALHTAPRRACEHSAGLNGTKIRSSWDGSSSRRDGRIQPRVSTPGNRAVVATRPKRAQGESDRNIHILCIYSVVFDERYLWD